MFRGNFGMEDIHNEVRAGDWDHVLGIEAYVASLDPVMGAYARGRPIPIMVVPHAR